MSRRYIFECDMCGNKKEESQFITLRTNSIILYRNFTNMKEFPAEDKDLCSFICFTTYINTLKI